ncbi:MAG: hypothetical protein EOP84_10515 [Verrucomicrobiaceae bacterium]|nr:MAG: hypothetical protein EOP84_10515 [Verrucomicrobiaceae bacterium]
MADLFRIIESSYEIATRISQITPFGISILIPHTSGSIAHSRIETVIEDSEKSSSGLAKFGAGVYDSEIGKKNNFSRENSLYFSRFSASDIVLTDEKKINIFNESTPASILNQHRKLRKQSDGQKDYKRLVELGIDTALFHNQGALCYMESKNADLDDALRAANRAVDLLFEPTFIANRAVISFMRGNYEACDEDFRTIKSKLPDYNLPQVYFSTKSMAAALCFKNGLSDYLVTDILNNLKESLKEENSLTYVVSTKALNNMINELENKE